MIERWCPRPYCTLESLLWKTRMGFGVLEVHLVATTHTHVQGDEKNECHLFPCCFCLGTTVGGSCNSPSSHLLVCLCVCVSLQHLGYCTARAVVVAVWEWGWVMVVVVVTGVAWWWQEWWCGCNGWWVSVWDREGVMSVVWRVMRKEDECCG